MATMTAAAPPAEVPAASPHVAAPVPEAHVAAPGPAPAPAVTHAVDADSKALVTSPPETAASAEAGAVVPHEKGEKVETEPGTIVHMERALQKVEHDKLHHNAKAWEENAKTKIESRTQRELAKIAAWEATQKTKAETKNRKAEESLEKQRAKNLERMKNEIALAHKSAEEKRALEDAKKGQDLLKAEETAAKIRATGIFPKKYGCFSA